MDLGLAGKVAIVTGTNRMTAMGATIALTLAREGADVACVDIVQPGAEEVAQAIKGLGRRAIAVKADQSDHEQVKAAVAQIKAELGPPVVLVNNAAMMDPAARIDKFPIDLFKTFIKIDIDGPYYWIREVWSSMVEAKWGRIINIASIAGVQGSFGQVAYSSAKAGVIAMAKTAALEGARSGITANAVTLGVVDTKGTQQTGPQFDRIKQRIAMREFGNPQDVANAVAFLVSDKASYITGQDLHVMGGLDLFTF